MPLNLSDLPAHPAFENFPPSLHHGIRKHAAENSSSSDGSKPSQDPDLSTSTPPPLRDFISAILLEADNFIENTLPATFTTTATARTSKPALAKVAVLKRMVKRKDLKDVPWDAGPVNRRWMKKILQMGGGKEEAWFARRSRHANQSMEGTADWPEFDEGLRVDHSEKERMYTPNVYDSHRVLDWDDQTRGMEFEGGWRQVDMRSKFALVPGVALLVTSRCSLSFSLTYPFAVYEMAHSMPFPLRPRAFPVLVITASLPCRANAGDQHPTRACADPHHPTALLVVQIPICMVGYPLALYSSFRNLKDGSTPQKLKKTVIGSYVSIEKCSFMPDLNIQWVMATASDAKGSLPMWMQKLGVPGAVVKDVGLFVDWVKGRRREE